ncbi:hypothetical protein A2W54_04265 [Candidatus Giovannonibacteria bacterium RIFCSPHIGHO2_02_43_13]|uniref:Uncharacterized protein n=1 Tax=Candidatus Giovannonibacteria bacterium RIFCSPHIGHO2_02_43_13 TaxID=1798330 RepID=A0A1F5WT70_9BACT|nr:MAG: hypothetical protein UW28_C0013G0048 [Parcubacteria group bacterium GW2011_GWA2_44_13]OGF74672.1 MAG: hypothetical protein A3E06_03060 [Candidatus Giovannonibacteria bacterium RIFCSPHIGHO2_12_FULL_44_42]OGF78833.1 MAG: hypothetical protein A2W54_04265 [Candidatus Giovannonibacteria bacterium RIFCSPHIGHO2_02_43_13]OGF90093.1 MAG: hypothetical protein A3I94_03165 [Candidatus Giovannonibacteria bacterium RIFCSPLOWO2_02_FULL_43_54]OGF96634.1 MAG: hypothetical protein A3H08_01705 [Candidatus
MTFEIRFNGARLADWFPVVHVQYNDAYKSSYITFDIRDKQVRDRLHIVLGVGNAIGALRCENKRWLIETKNTHRHIDKQFLYGEVLDSNGQFSPFLLHP